MTLNNNFDILNTDKPGGGKQKMNLDNLKDLDERLESEEFNEKLESNNYSPLDDIFNNTPSGNTLADTGRYPE